MKWTVIYFLFYYKTWEMLQNMKNLKFAYTMWASILSVVQLFPLAFSKSLKILFSDSKSSHAHFGSTEKHM